MTAHDIWALDLFAGAGPMALGFKNAGVKVALAIEQDSIAAATYRAKFPGTPVYEGNIASFLPWADLSNLRGQISIVFGGPSCQVFSTMSGRAIGCISPRNAVPLYLEVIEKVRPLALCLENVFGLINQNNFPYLLEVKRGLVELGYTLSDGILRAEDFGVPQKRPRYFLLGIQSDIPIPLPTPTHGVGALPLVRPRDVLPWWNEGRRLGNPSPAMYGPNPKIGNDIYNSAFFQSNRVRLLHPDKSSATLATVKNSIPIIAEAPDELEAYLQSLQRGNKPRKGVVPGAFHLSIEEAKRIQGIPDDYPLEGTEAEQWRQIGNSVVPAVAEAVAKSMVHAIRKLPQKLQLTRTPPETETEYDSAISLLEAYVRYEFSPQVLEEVEIICNSFTPTSVDQKKLMLQVAEIAEIEGHTDILVALGNNYFVSSEVIVLLASHPNIEIRSAIARNPGLVKWEGQVASPVVDVIYDLSADPSSEVVQALASNAALLARKNPWTLEVIGNLLIEESTRVARELAANPSTPSAISTWPDAWVWKELAQTAVKGWGSTPVAKAFVTNPTVSEATEKSLTLEGFNVVQKIFGSIIDSYDASTLQGRDLWIALTKNPLFCRIVAFDRLFSRVGVRAVRDKLFTKRNVVEESYRYFSGLLKAGVLSRQYPKNPKVMQSALSNPCFGFARQKLEDIAAEMPLWRQAICQFFSLFTAAQQNAILQNSGFADAMDFIPHEFYANDGSIPMARRALIAKNGRTWFNDEMFYWLADPDIQPTKIRCALASAPFELSGRHEIGALLNNLEETLDQDPSPKVAKALQGNPYLQSILHSRLDVISE